MLIVPFTGTQATLRFPGTLAVQPNGQNGLTVPSVALVFQLTAIDKANCLQPLGVLDPATLEHDGARLFCRVRKGAFSARFGRLAMQQIAPWLGDDGTGPAITLGGQHWPLGAIRPRAHTSQPRTQTK